MNAAIVTVGDELLVGDTVNTNAAWLGNQLDERGVTVRQTVVVPDDEGAIAREVNEARAEYDVVLVTGGLGPTHDDVTMSGVAAAFGRDLAESQEALDWLETHRDYARADLTDGTGDIPAGARMLPNREGVAPGCAIESVYVLPGVPDEMKTMFQEVEDEFEGARSYVETVLVDEPESALLDRFEALRERFDVIVGSYPGSNVRVKLEGDSEATVREAADWLRKRVDQPS
jgi:molybdenum cofactor synthesis domain-containing protein